MEDVEALIAEKDLMLSELSKFVLSALDADISVGAKAKDYVMYKHQITESDIKLDVTTDAATLNIIVDIQKNGTSIFFNKTSNCSRRISFSWKSYFNHKLFFEVGYKNICRTSRYGRNRKKS